jgi:aarF domain-containing kinase
MLSSTSRCGLRASRGKLVSTNYANRSRAYASKTKSNDGISLWYPVVGGFVITIAGGIKYTHDHFGGTEGLNRTVSFYKIAIPKYVQYRWHMFRESPDDIWDQLHRETSETALDKMLELEGFYIKTGQMCAANIGNAFPKIWQETMAILQDQVPYKSYDVVKEIIEVDMGKPLNEVFASFETTPIGSASIGQVHRATLPDGTHVVVKVMYPHVERLFRGDVRTIKLFAQLAQPVHVPALEEIEKQFMTEFDYRAEATQLAQVRENLTKAGLAGDSSTKLCVIPRPYLDLCTKRVLVMEELKGDKLAVALMKDAQRHAERAGQNVEEFLAEQHAKEKEAKAQGLEYQGPSATQMATYISLLNHQRQLSNAWSLLHNVTVGWIPGFKWRGYKGKDVLPINHAKMVDDLIYVHGWEVLVDGYFNGDPQ